MKIQRKLRPQGGSRRLRGNDVKAIAKSKATWCKIGKVTERDGSHFAIEDNDVRVEVTLMPDGQPCYCRLAAPIGGAGRGDWLIPPVGTEVLVFFPEGTVEGEAIVLGALATGQPVSGLDGSTRVIAVASGQQVLIHDGSSGQAVALATKSDVQSLVNTFNAHTHGGVQSGGGVTSTTAPATPPSGTSVLKAK